MYSKQVKNKLEKTPKQEYLEMMREKLLNEPKSKKPKKFEDDSRYLSKSKKKGKKTKF